MVGFRDASPRRLAVGGIGCALRALMNPSRLQAVGIGVGLLLLAGCSGALPKEEVIGPGDAVPMIRTFKAVSSEVPVGTRPSFMADFTGFSGSVDHGIGEVKSGEAFKAPAEALDGSVVYTLTVTGAQGLKTSSTVKVRFAPVGEETTDLKVEGGKGTVTNGGTVRLVPIFPDSGSGLMDQGIGVVKSGVPVVVTPAANSSTTYTLTVTYPGGTTQSKAFVVTAVPPPVINFFTVQ